MILGLIDIEANYLVIKAYQYTTLTSVQVGYTPANVYECVFVHCEGKKRKIVKSKKRKRSGLKPLLCMSDWQLKLGCLLHVACHLIFIKALLVLKEPYSRHC